MKPLRLHIEAFGPYADSATLDFRRLHGQPLFLIHGPTGGGKTALLDAMCFALFGTTSGNERSGAELRSAFAASDKLTRVSFDFAHGTRRLRVVREPQQDRPKARGDGMTVHSAQAWLWDRSALAEGDDGSEGRLLAEKVSAVTAEITQLLGFSDAQFRQIVVLPQGRFREFLTASSEQKQQILQTLFDTALYARIEGRLADRERDLKNELANDDGRLAALLQAVEVDSIGALQSRVEHERELLVQRKAAVEPAREAARASQQALDAAVAGNRAVHDDEQAQAELRRLRDVAPTIEGIRARLAVAVRARPLPALATDARTRRQAADRAGMALLDARNRAESAGERLERFERTLEHERSDERTQARHRAEQEHARLQALAEDAARLEPLRDEAAQAAAALARARADAESATEALAKLERQVAQGREALPDVTAAAVAVEQARAEHGAAVQRVEIAALRDAAAGVAVQSGREADEAAQRASDAEEAARRSEADEKGLRMRWFAGQAALLAAELEAGTPCPVCGSAEHPSPAHTDEPLPTEEALDAAERRVADARRLAEQERTTRDRLRTRQTTQQAQAKEHDGRLGARAGAEHAALVAESEAAGEALRAAQRAHGQAQQARDGLARLEAAVPAARQGVQDAQAALLPAEGAAREAKAAAEAVHQRIPEALRGPGAFAEALARAARLREDLARALDKAREDQAEASRNASSAAEALRAATEDAARRNHEAAQAEAAFAEARVAAELTDDAELQRALADLAAESTLSERVRTHDDAIAKAEGAAQATAAARAGRQRVETAELEAIVRERAAEQQRAESAVASAEARLKQLEEAGRRHTKIVEEQAGRREIYERVATIAEVARGKNARRMSLQRFVLAALLEDVLRYASERLQRMSSGRYRLTRRDDVGDARSAGGLDLLVDDAYSGDCRPVATLSGGESFMAALALSLGLSDVVQALAGGVRIDALFIDEGFGTLDGEALERALDQLLDLQDGGRMVGIISHVAELRQRIETRVEVVPSRVGSTLRLHVSNDA
ncbi:MAG: hypothetical protein RIT45_1579 [Pseudomonadota bacterium]|jgi:exonuclease SbcC